MKQARLAFKVYWRLVFPCLLFMLLSSLDRANVSFAAATMSVDLGLTPADYGFGAGVLFAGFLAGQYPSLYLLQRLGMRRWIAGCALVWGASAAGMAFIASPAEFYALRILLGLAEGGLAPGIVYYLSQFASERERATTFTLPMLAIPLSVVIGAPLSGWLLQTSAGADLASWRWMFLAEALPTVLAGLAAMCYFPDTPDHAKWLEPSERRWLAEHASRRERGRGVANEWRALHQPLVVLSGLLWFCLLSGSYGVIFWLPQVLHALTGLAPLQIGLIGALPWIGVAVGMYGNAAHSDRTGERYWHVALPAGLAALFLLLAWLAGGGLAAILALLLAGLGLGAAQGAFWALPTQFLRPAALGVAVVGINIAGSAGGFVMPMLMGLARERSGGFALPTALVAAVLVLAAVMVALIRRFYPPALATLPPRRAS